MYSNQDVSAVPSLAIASPRRLGGRNGNRAYALDRTPRKSAVTPRKQLPLEAAMRAVLDKRELEEPIRPRDASHAHLRDDVVAVMDFHNHTMSVWHTRVARLDGHGRCLSVADTSFLERAATRLAMCIDQIKETSKALLPFTRGLDATSKWGRYAKSSYERLCSVEASANEMQSRIARLLSTSISTSPAMPKWAVTPQPTNARPSHAMPQKTGTARTDRSPPVSAVRLSSCGSSSAEGRSSSSLAELRGFGAVPKHSTSAGAYRTLQSPVTSRDGNSSRESSLSRYRQQQHQKKQHNKQQQQRQRHATAYSHRHPSWTEVSTQHSSGVSNSVSPFQSMVSRCSEPFFERGRDEFRQREWRANEPLYDGSSGTLTHDNNTTPTRHPSGPMGNYWRGISCDSTSFQKRNSCAGSGGLEPNQHRMLLERIDAMGRTPYVLNATELEEAEVLFKELYGARNGPKQYVAWVDDMTLRSLRHRRAGM
ncbi:hypothetical protein DQ04_00971160 [Trypanosoma grayi]|uniref:hypothetical protein n=1 Tax=Trypanosoma grayi TaxID=71804 RepID=UPI0004F41565|nr:hypothetical protein DQ04_00971160 [Trypanosoma grayi]KEG13506.1 hypothetical protein DQ04_00971160 [Trypanosoma grayi]